MRARLSYYSGIYELLLDNYSEAYNKALKLKETLDTQEMSNCKLIVTRISQFQLAETIVKMKQAIERFKNFWELTY